ncbi:MAG: hypothetical protein JSR33_12700 [Proteobacteria bacterium]|nr:hypothetical protein [Pseudomonadota bacterium]
MSFLITIITSALLGAIWLLPNYLHVVNESIFANIIMQIVLSGFVVVISSLFLYKKKSSGAGANPPKKLYWQKFWNYIKKITLKTLGTIKSYSQTHIRQKNKLLKRLPWFLIAGNEQSGKSCLLLQSNLNSLPTDYLTELSKGLGYPHQWHLSKETVLLEMSLKENSAIPENFWLAFTKFSRRFNRKTAFNGVIFTIDMIEVITSALSAKESSQLLPLKTLLNQLNNLFKVPIPVYFILTKCDQIAGFQEYFFDFSKEAREQPWGLIFSRSNDLHNEFVKEFDNLIIHLKQRLFGRLENEPDAGRKIKITCFPEQIMLCKKWLSEFILSHGYTQLQGVFFTSSMQQGQAWDPAISMIAAQYHLPTPSNEAVESQKKAYFIKQLFPEIILPKKNWVFQTADWRQRNLIINRATLSAVGLLSVLAIVVLSFSFIKNQRSLTVVKEYIPLYEQAVGEFSISNRNLVDLLPVFANFKRIYNLYQPANRSILANLELYQPWSIHHQMDKIWQYNLSNLLIPRIFARLEYLLQEPNLDPEITYQALKGYFVFSPDSTFDGAWLMNPIAYDLSISSKNQQNYQQQILNYLQESATYPIKPRTLNQTLIQQAQLRLKSIPAAQFTYYELKQLAEQSAHQIDLADSLGEHFSTVFYSDHPETNKLPHFYTLQGYADLKSNRSKEFIQQSAQTYRILGINSKDNPNALTVDMTPALWSLYGTDYIQHWQTVINSLHISRFNDLNQGIQVLNSLLETNGPLTKLLLLIKDNTDTLNTNNLPVAQEFATINNFAPTISLKKNQNTPYDDLAKNLHNLRDYFISLSNAPDAEQTEFQDAVSIINNKSSNHPIMLLRHQAEQLPMPLRQWVTEIADNSIRLLLQGARQNVNKNWQNSVLPYYRSNIYGHFPFALNDSHTVTLDNFSNFFGGKGVFYQFYQTYLAPFINNNHHTWKLAEIDNLNLNLSNTAINQIQLAVMINNMYFPEGDNKASIKFSIQPLFLDPESSSVNLQLANQSLAYRHGPQQSIPFILPIEGDTQQVVIAFSDFQGQNFSKSIEGSWSWFKMLNSPGFTQDKIPGHYVWNYSDKNHRASFYIVTENNQPLFDFKMLKEFRLPDTL